jgi:hypothetical protein
MAAAVLSANGYGEGVTLFIYLAHPGSNFYHGNYPACNRASILQFACIDAGGP